MPRPSALARPRPPAPRCPPVPHPRPSVAGPGLARPPLQPKNTPPRLKSFLEKTLTRANPPPVAPTIPELPPPHRPDAWSPSARPSPSSLPCWLPLVPPSGPPPSSGPGRTSAAAPRTSTSASSPPCWCLSLGPLGALLYLLLRPAETLDEVHLRQLQEDTLLQDMEAASAGPATPRRQWRRPHHRPKRLSGAWASS